MCKLVRSIRHMGVEELRRRLLELQERNKQLWDMVVRYCSNCVAYSEDGCCSRHEIEITPHSCCSDHGLRCGEAATPNEVG